MGGKKTSSSGVAWLAVFTSVFPFAHMTTWPSTKRGRYSHTHTHTRFESERSRAPFHAATSFSRGLFCFQVRKGKGETKRDNRGGVGQQIPQNRHPVQSSTHRAQSSRKWKPVHVLFLSLSRVCCTRLSILFLFSFYSSRNDSFNFCCLGNAN